MVQGSWRMAQIDENIAFPQVLERDPGQNIGFDLVLQAFLALKI